MCMCRGVYGHVCVNIGLDVSVSLLYTTILHFEGFVWSLRRKDLIVPLLFDFLVMSLNVYSYIGSPGHLQPRGLWTF